MSKRSSIASSLRDARAMGYRIAILHSSPVVEEMYRRLGFQEYCKLLLRQFHELF